MTAEKTFTPTVSQHQQPGTTFFRKAAEEGFFGQQQRGSFFGQAIQPKLSVSQPGDPQEQEADAVADQVMRMPEPSAANPVQRQDETGEGSLMRLPDAAEMPLTAPKDEEHQKLNRKEEEEEGPSVQPLLMRKCAECENEEQVHAKLMRSPDGSAEDLTPAAGVTSFAMGGEQLHPKAHGPPAGNFIQRSGRAPPAPDHTFETTLQSSKGGGAPLPVDTRQSLESRFGADFSSVRIHTGTQAESLSTGIHAQAFTHGGDIYFNSGKYAPNTDSGGHLLAHELTHTIQQGASRPVSGAQSDAVAPKLQRAIAGSQSPVSNLQRAASSRPVPSQLNNAVAKAKGEEGKVNANKEGPDGFRTGHDRLIEYFKTTLGEDKVVAAGGPAVQGAIAEQDIKKKREITGALVPAHPAIERKGPYKRDAMPSWCGIFVFWALHKAGVPMKPWGLGGRNVTPDAAYPPGYTPQAGDIAYRNDYSHFAIVEKASGDTITTVNGNTAGEDNLGGQVQTRDHPRSGWTAFFDPLMLKDGPLSSGETSAEEVRPLSISELRKKLFNVDRKQEESVVDSQQSAVDGEQKEAEVGSGQQAGETDTAVQAKPELSSWNVNASGAIQRNAAPVEEEKLQAKEEDKKEEDKIGGQHEPSIQKKGDNDTCAANETAAPTQSNSIQLPPTSSNDIQHSNNPTFQQSNTPTNLASRGPPRVQLKANGIIQRSWLGDAWDAVGDAVSGAVEWAEDQINEAKEWILEQIRDFVSNIPGYRLLTLILEEDPITGARVARTGANMLDEGLNILPLGDLFRQVLIRTGTYNEAADFVLGRVDDFVSMASGIGSRFNRFVEGLSITDIGDPQGVFNSVASLLHDVISSIVGFITRSAEDFIAMIKRIMINAVVSFVRSRIPRLWPLLTVALGYDPITNEEVPRNGTNILNALFEVTDAGREQRRQLQETGTFQKVADWIDRGIAVFTNLYNAIRTGFTAIWNIISIESLFSPLETFERIYDHFVTPVSDVWNFVRDTAAIIISFIKEALLSRLSAWAREQRGYFLITLLIRRDPFTNNTVPFTVENVIHAFMSLMEGGEAQYQQMKESGAIDRTTNRVMAAVRRLNFTVEYIVGLFSGLWSTLQLSDLANPPMLFRRVLGTFARPVTRLVSFVVEIVRIVVEVLLQLMQFPTDLIANIISRAMEAWDRIKRDPIGFLKNLLRAIKQGFVQFFDHILDHLLHGLTGWLMSELRDAGVPELTDFSLRGVITWVLQVLNISMEAIWQKLAAHPRIGPERVARLRSMISRVEGIWTFIRDVQERGIAAIWDKIQEQLGNLWNTILDAVKNWIMREIVDRIVTRLLMMLDPTGIMAVINSAIALYRAIQSFIRYLRQILEVINSFVTGLADIAAGNISTAANYLEQTMRRAMPIVIGFLANQVGLSGIGRRVGEMIVQVRTMVDNALTWLVNRAVDTGFALFERLMAAGRSAVSAVLGWLGFRQRFTTNSGVQHTIYIRDAAQPALIIESAPTNVAEFFDQKTTEINTSTTMPENEKATKLRSIQNGRNFLRDVQNLMNSDKVAQRNNPAIPRLIGNIIAIVQEIDPGAVALAVPNPEFTPGFTATKAGSFSARYVYNGGGRVAANHAPGTEPSDANLVEEWQVLRDMQLSSRWVKFHILNHNVGGIASNSNLIPTPSYYNNEYRSEFEDQLKAYYRQGRPIWLRANVTYRSEYAGYFARNLSAQGGAMKMQNNAWIEDPERRLQFSKSVDLPQTDTYNINAVIASTDDQALLRRLTTISQAMINTLRTRRPAGGYTNVRQMERVLVQSLIPNATDFTPEHIATFNPSAQTVTRISEFRRGIGSVNWTF